jgi:hypothetical protein
MTRKKLRKTSTGGIRIIVTVANLELAAGLRVGSSIEIYTSHTFH